MANSVNPDETARYVSSGSTLFANVAIWIYRAERVNSDVKMSMILIKLVQRPLSSKAEYFQANVSSRSGYGKLGQTIKYSGVFNEQFYARHENCKYKSKILLTAPVF